MQVGRSWCQTNTLRTGIINQESGYGVDSRNKLMIPVMREDSYLGPKINRQVEFNVTCIFIGKHGRFYDNAAWWQQS